MRQQGQVLVTIHLTDKDGGQAHLKSILMRLGHDTEVPLSLDDKGMAQFTLRESLVDATSLRLITGSNGTEAKLFIAPFTAFCRLQ